VLTTAMLVPFEVWELTHHTTLTKIAALLINLLVVWYLVHRIRSSPDSEAAAGPRDRAGPARLRSPQAD